MNQEKPYAKFHLVEETATDGWCLGTIMNFVGHSWGDAFVEAPDGSRAGIVWVLSDTEFEMILPADDDSWGVYRVPFPKPMSSLADLADNFRAVLPKLKQAYASARNKS